MVYNSFGVVFYLPQAKLNMMFCIMSCCCSSLELPSNVPCRVDFLFKPIDTVLFPENLISYLMKQL